MGLMQYFIITLDYGGCRGIVTQGGTMSDVKKKHFVGCGIVTQLLDVSSSVVRRKTLLPFEDPVYDQGRKLRRATERVTSAVKACTKIPSP
jgi:hypothetical protein